MVPRLRSRHAVMAAALGLGVAATACGSSATSSAGGGPSATVTVQNIAYSPSSISLAANTQVTITFVNKDSVTHSLTFDDNSQSVQAAGGQTQTLTFTAPASGTTIAFHCMFHSSMHGTISIGGQGGGAAPSSSSSTSAPGGYGGYGK
jgi:plastocyanin